MITCFPNSEYWNYHDTEILELILMIYWFVQIMLCTKQNILEEIKYAYETLEIPRKTFEDLQQ